MATVQSGPSRIELELALRAAVLAASPRECGRAQAAQVTRSLLKGLVATALLVAGYDVYLLVLAQ